MMQRVRVADLPDQQLSIRTEDRRLTLRLRLNPLNDRWSFDMAVDDDWVIFGRRIVPGTDLLAAFDDLSVGMILAHETSPTAEPNRAGLVNGHVELYHVA